jgi:3-(3-hydroxy-phenyl)propionate hydroxylase
LDGSPLNTPDEDDFGPDMRPGSVCRDAPIITGGKPTWLLGQLGNRFTLLVYGGATENAALADLQGTQDLQLLTIGFDSDCGLPCRRIDDVQGFIEHAYQLQPGTCYLIRPDQHVCARWRRFAVKRVITAMQRALGKLLEESRMGA